MKDTPFNFVDFFKVPEVEGLFCSLALTRQCVWRDRGIATHPRQWSFLLKILKHPLLWLLIGIGVAIAITYVHAQNRTTTEIHQPDPEPNPTISKPVCDPVLHPSQPKTDCYYKAPVKGIQQIVGKTDLKNAHPIDAEKLRIFLGPSPLAAYSEQIVKSDFAALIIGICWIEQYSCQRAPGNNYWGMMKAGGGLRQFASLPEAITFMDQYFVRLYPRRSTVESLRGYYCASLCTNWESTVLKIKQQIENL